jgi:hypothetical protein
MQETQTFTLTRDGQRDVRFEGWLLAEVDNETLRGERQWRWTELSLYKTKGGKFVLAIDGITQWQGKDSHDVYICDSEKAVITALTEHFCALEDLAKELLAKAGIEAIEDITAEPPDDIPF